MQYNNLRKRKYFAFITELLLVLILSILLMSPDILERILLHKISQAGNYSVSKISVHMFRMGGVLKEIKLINLPVNKSIEVTGTINQVEVFGLSPIKFLLGKNSEINNITVWSPDIKLIRKINLDSADTVEDPPVIKISSIEYFVIHKGRVQYFDNFDGRISIQNLSLDISPLKLDTTYKSKKPLTFSFFSGAINYTTADSLYNLFVYKTHGSSDNRELIFDSVKVTPGFNENEFSKHLKFQTDRFNFSSPKIVVSLPEKKEQLEEFYHVNEIKFESPSLAVYRDKKIIRNPDKKYNMLQHYMREAPVKLLIDSLFVDNGKIRYKELAEASDEAGEIEFTNSQISLHNIKTGLDTSSEMVIKLHSTFMDSGTITAKLFFPYSEDYFRCEGKLLKMPFNLLNKMTRPNAGVVFNKGYINSMDFNFKAYNIYSSGKLNIQYRDMEFLVSKKMETAKPGIFTRVKSAAAGLFIKKEGKKDNVNISLDGIICQERNKDRFLFNYIWKSLLSGIRSALTEKFTPESQTSNTKLPC